MYFAISDIIICSCLLLRYKILRFFSTQNRNICQQFHCRRWCHCHVPHFHSKKYYQKVAPIFEAIKLNEEVIDSCNSSDDGNSTTAINTLVKSPVLAVQPRNHFKKLQEFDPSYMQLVDWM